MVKKRARKSGPKPGHKAPLKAKGPLKAPPRVQDLPAPGVADDELARSTVEGNRLKFDLKVEKPMKITLKYDITVSGDRLSGKVKMGIFGSAKVSGERA